MAFPPDLPPWGHGAINRITKEFYDSILLVGFKIESLTKSRGPEPFGGERVIPLKEGKRNGNIL